MSEQAKRVWWEIAKWLDEEEDEDRFVGMIDAALQEAECRGVEKTIAACQKKAFTDGPVMSDELDEIRTRLLSQKDGESETLSR